ncbi:MAG: hypothetical protein AAF067_07510 [Pseudomonadota bacterium]
MKTWLKLTIFIGGSLVYWIGGAPITDHFAYVWGGRPDFGITDDRSPWPLAIMALGYIILSAGYFLLSSRFANPSNPRGGQAK